MASVQTQVNIQALLVGEQAACLAQMARADKFSHALLDRISINKHDATDLIEASAAKQIGDAGLSGVLAALQAVKPG